MQVMLKAQEGSCGILSPGLSEYTCNSSCWLEKGMDAQYLVKGVQHNTGLDP